MIERKIIIGLIVSTEFCSKIKGIWNVNLFESATARRIASWVWEYFEKYDKAPGKDIEGIYFSKIKEGKFSKEFAEEVEQDILPSLSEEFVEQGINVVYLVEETEKYFHRQHIKLLVSNVQATLEANQINEAEKFIDEFKPLQSIVEGLDNYILSVEEIRAQNRAKPALLMKPWLREGQTTILYGNYGCGKSLLTTAVAYLLGLRDYQSEESVIGEWIVSRPIGCLYLDGELGEQEMEERVGKFEWLGEQRRSCKIRILSVPEYQLKTEDSFYLSNRDNQIKIIKWLSEHPSYKLIVLDSASTLFGLEDENDNSEWNNKINPFLRDLRALGVANILLHHSGKDGKKGLRGASAMGAMAHNIFRLTNHPDQDVDKGEAWFVLSKDKQRAGGRSFKNFALHFYQNTEQTETHWEVTELK